MLQFYFNKSYKQYSPFGIFAVLRSSLNSGRPSAVIRSIFISYFRIKNVFSVFIPIQSFLYCVFSENNNRFSVFIFQSGNSSFKKGCPAPHQYILVF